MVVFAIPIVILPYILLLLFTRYIYSVLFHDSCCHHLLLLLCLPPVSVLFPFDLFDRLYVIGDRQAAAAAGKEEGLSWAGPAFTHAHMFDPPLPRDFLLFNSIYNFISIYKFIWFI